jgi:hypothetical protein
VSIITESSPVRSGRKREKKVVWEKKKGGSVIVPVAGKEIRFDGSLTKVSYISLIEIFPIF